MEEEDTHLKVQPVLFQHAQAIDKRAEASHGLRDPFAALVVAALDDGGGGRGYTHY